MKELNKNEIYSLEGLSDEQLEVLAERTELSIERLKDAKYVVYNHCWKYGDFLSIPNAKAIDLFEEEEKPSQYKIGIDTFKRCESNMTKEEILACCKFNIDKYNWRKKGQDKEDFEKIINYAKWALEQLK